LARIGHAGISIAPTDGGRQTVVMAYGTVKFFKAEKGWGAITSPELPEGFDAWVHFTVIEMGGYRALETGDRVEFTYEAVEQDSFRFRATRVRKLP
jgi:cold shock protein